MTVHILDEDVLERIARVEGNDYAARSEQGDFGNHTVAAFQKRFRELTQEYLSEISYIALDDTTWTIQGSNEKGYVVKPDGTVCFRKMRLAPVQKQKAIEEGFDVE